MWTTLGSWRSLLICPTCHRTLFRCECGYITGAVIAASILSAAVTAYSSYAQGQAASQAARYNARVAEQQAESARQAAAADAETRRRQLDRVLGAQRARYGASGVIPSEGSPLLVMMESEEEAALDVARVRHGGAAAAHGLGLESSILRRQARQASRAGFLSGTAALLTGVSSLLGSSTGGRSSSTSGSATSVPPYRGGFD